MEIARDSIGFLNDIIGFPQQYTGKPRISIGFVGWQKGMSRFWEESLGLARDSIGFQHHFIGFPQQCTNPRISIGFVG